MVAETREGRLVGTFVTLADTLVAGFDVVDLLQTLVEACAELLDASAAGILLVDEEGELAVVASTSEQSRLVEMMQLRTGFGPCVESYNTGVVVAVPDIQAVADRWPEFAHDAAELGFAAVHAVPLRLRGTILGTLNLFRAESGTFDEEDASAAQGLADVATIGILQERAVRENEMAREQLQHALNSRVVIEQAKGVLAQTHGIDMETAFNTLRRYARNHSLPLREVALQVVARSLNI